MNKVILLGRLTRDPDVRYSSGENSTAVARYTLAVDRRFHREGDSATADFIGCVALAVSRICREISAAGNEDRHHRSDPNRKLYEP